MEKIGEYINRLRSYNLSISTKKQYLYYYKKIYEVVGEIELTDEIANAFLKDYPNSICMAMLNDYINWKRLRINLEKRIVDRKRKKDKRYITRDEIKRLGKYMERYDPKFKIMLYLSYYCALRRKEILGLNSSFLIKDLIRWKKNSNKSLRLTIHKKSAKRKKERKAIVPPVLAGMLYDYVSDNAEIIKSTNHPNNVFRIKEVRWQNVFKDAVRKCLKEDYTLHELRFSRATYWHKKGLDIVTIQKLLGHANISTTQLYIDPEQESALRKAEMLYNK